MVLINLLFWLAVHYVVVINEVHIGTVDITVGRVTTQHGDVIRMRELIADTINHIFIDLMDTAPTAGNLSRKAHIARF